MVRIPALVLFLLAAGTAHAQRVPVPPSYAALSAEARAVASDTLPALRTRAVAGGRVDAATGVYRAAYRLALPAADAGAPEAAARAALPHLADRFGWPADASDLQLVEVRAGRYTAHVTFRQTVGGVPVYGRTVRLSLDRAGRPTFVLSGYDPALAAAGLDLRPTVPAAEAAAHARAAVGGGAVALTEPALVVVPGAEGAPPRLAWQAVARPEGTPGEWDVLVDAHTGTLVTLLDLTTHAHDAAPKDAPADARRARFASRFTLPDAPVPTPAGRVDGAGLVFDPDPLTTAGRAYAPPFVDQDDADVDALNAERRLVTLRGLTQGDDGRYRLQGPYVEVTGDRAVGGFSYTPPAETDPQAFRYTRADPAFEAVMVYHHIDASQRYLQSLDAGHPIQQDAPIRVNPHGLGNGDNSQYYSWSNALAFGRGGIDDAEDADVILHEYGHALLEGSAPGMLGTAEGKALHEGWSDYWAASYSRILEETGVVPTRTGENWRRLYTWDGNAGTWCGRTLDHPGRYPNDTAHPPRGDCWSDALYEQGALWATTLMEIYSSVGRRVSDRLNLASHGYLDRQAGFVDAAHALVQADFDLYAGAHVETLVEVLSGRGYLPPDAYAAALRHEPLASTSKTGGTVRVEVQAGMQVDVEAVTLVYRIGEGAEAQMPLARTGTYLFTGDLPLPADLALVTYHLEGVDAQGRTVRLPTSGTFRFVVGVDAAPPVAAHTPAAYASAVSWPLRLAATVTDNLGVDAVWVRYGMGPAGAEPPALTDSLAFTAAAAGYAGTLDLPLSYLRSGEAVYYTLGVRDVAGNMAVYPAAGGAYEVPFHSSRQVNVLAEARPSGGWRAWAGGWSVDAEANGHATLVLAPLAVPANVNEAVFALTHAVRLTEGGANVKLSADDGRTWTVLAPAGGYPDRFADGHPMGGEPVFQTADATTLFDLGPWAGETIRLRLDAGAAVVAAGEGWTVEAAEVRAATPAPDFEAPENVVLHANFPDPFADATTISFTLPRAAAVDLAVYDLLGRRVAVLATGEAPAGTRTLSLDGARLAAGVYFLQLQADGRRLVERMVVAR